MQVQINLLAVCFLSMCLSNVLSYTQYDFKGLDVEKVLSNQRLLDAHIKCYLDKGPCPALLKKVKVNLSEALDTRCLECNEIQAKDLMKALKKIRETRPEEFEEILKKFAAKPDDVHDWLN